VVYSFERWSSWRAGGKVNGLLFCLLWLCLSACAGKQMEDWHNKKLKSEFTAKDADTVVTFADYLALEDELFEELEANSYVPASSDKLVLRYSKGSLADPTVHEINWNRSYELPVADPVGGVLLLHGMSDSPYSLRSMALKLHARGFYVVGLRMPGHGTAPSGIVHVDWQDMAAATRLGMNHLQQQLAGGPVHIVGYSTGATLALDYALDALAGNVAPQVSSLVLISPAIGITPVAGMAKVTDGLSVLPGFKGLAYTAIEPEFDPYKYNSFTSNAAKQVHGVTRSVSKRIAKLSSTYSTSEQRLPPMLIFQSTVDATVSNGALVDKLLLRLDPGRHELVLFDINRLGANFALMVSDPAPITDRLIANTALPVDVTFVSNENDTSIDVAAYHKSALEGEVDAVEPLDLAWPIGVISLSHVALPISPDDPIYGSVPPEDEDQLYLGGMNIKGEKGLLVIPPSFLVRLRYNPFYSYLEQRSVDWMDAASGSLPGKVPMALDNAEKDPVEYSD
jgi:alpha-beta hydrolase superfamily lysophospholipase